MDQTRVKKTLGKSANPAKPPKVMAIASPTGTVPLTAALGVEINKPKDWQAFQRNCVLLFRDLLGDPHVQEYGRQGQNQRGIDILGKRDGDPEKYVGIQCRRVVKPLAEAKILSDCRAALAVNADLKEIIFATTASDDTKMTDAAVAVERTLTAEGRKISVSVYGWSHMQTLIATSPTAYAAFVPSASASSSPQTVVLEGQEQLAALISAQVYEKLRGEVVAVAVDAQPGSRSDEDPALHARIDMLRDLFKMHKQPRLAQKGLLEISTTDLEGRPWAQFRIETNLASVALDLGCEEEGAARYEAAHALRPDDPNAIANLALARTIQRRFDEAMELAKQALAMEPRADHAVAYLLQAAERSGWQGDPKTLVPDDLLDKEATAVGLAEFYRRREEEGWAESVLELCRQHPDSDDLKRVRGITVLAMAADDGGYLAGGRVAVTQDEIRQAGDDLRAVAEHMLDVGYAHEHDLEAFVNNAVVALRFARRHADALQLAERAIAKMPANDGLRQLLAIMLVACNRRADAIKALEAATSIQAKLFKIDLMSADDLDQALKDALAVDPGDDRHEQHLRWRLVAEFAQRQGDVATMRTAIDGLRTLDVKDPTALSFEIDADRKAGGGLEQGQDRLRVLAGNFPADGTMAARYQLAEQLSAYGLPDAAADLIEPAVDLSRQSPATTLYLQVLAEARRDTALKKALQDSTPAVREDPETLWTVAAHAWNVGDLAAAATALNALLAKQPDNSQARLLKIEVLLRQDSSSEVLAELDKPIEDLPWKRLNDQYRLAGLLGNFGYLERAATLAYRLFLQHRDSQPAWMTLSGLVLIEGRGDEKSKLFDAPVVAPNVAVDLVFDDGEKTFFVVEPDALIRKLDADSWEPGHALAQAVMGLPLGARFATEAGRGGVVGQLRHKFVARFHYVLEHYEERFPDIYGFERIKLEFDTPGGLDELIERVKQRRDWVQQQQDEYEKGNWPIAILAKRIGVDVIEVAGGLAANKSYINVARGGEDERNEASRSIHGNAGRGCVLDLLTYWTAWRIGALETIAAVCGPISMPQSVIDDLRARREKLSDGSEHGVKSSGYADGKLTIQEVEPEAFVALRDDMDAAINWALANTMICPALAGDDLLPSLREHLRAGRADFIDALVLAQNLNKLLITDDLVMRVWNSAAGSQCGSWLHQVLAIAVEQKVLDYEHFTRMTAQLLGSAQRSLGISALLLAHGLLFDLRDGSADFPNFRAISEALGGAGAEPGSHINVCASCLKLLWSDPEFIPAREWATGHLLRQLLRFRTKDHRQMFRIVAANVQDNPFILAYMRKWTVGHFMHDVWTIK